MKLKLIQLDNQRHKLTRRLLKGPPLRHTGENRGQKEREGGQRERERETACGLIGLRDPHTHSHSE